MAAATKLQVKNHILSKAKALGNSHYGIKEVCSDLINNHIGGNRKRLKQLAEGTFLSTNTLDRMATLKDTEDGLPYRPAADTCERILRYFDAEIYFGQTQIKSKYQNQPKHKED